MQNNFKLNERKLTVNGRYFERSFRGVILPEIRLCGKWLENSGFTCGKVVTVKHQQNCIIISLTDAKEGKTL
jgi:toxic protein SymE